MSTRSRIGIRRKDGSIESIYCHWDGYLSNNGKILFKDYQNVSKINELLELGNISSLRSELNDVVAYMRDRGETDQEKTIHQDIESFNGYMYDAWEEYVYIYDENLNEWLYAKVPYPFIIGALVFNQLKKGLEELEKEESEND